MTTEDPRDELLPAAADERPAGGDAPARAELLGTTALTMRVRCPCGKRIDADREDWQWNGVVICPRCGRGILDHSLHVVSRTQALSMLEERKPTESELRALRHMEMSLRHFTLRHGEHPRWYWSPPTNAMADEVGRLLAELDESRKDRGAPPVAAVGRHFLDDAGEVGYGSDADADDDDDDEEEDEPGEAPPRTAWDLVRARGRDASAGLEAELSAARQAAGEEEADEDEGGDDGEDEEALDEEEE